MKDIDEAIQHCEDVAQQQDMLKGRYDDASGYTRSGNEAIRTSEAKKCEKCAADHRQLAAWLKELKQLKEQEFCVTTRELSDDELEHLAEQMKKERWQLISVKQESCGDVISKAYIEPIIEELENICVNGDEHILDLLADIKNAPPVTPQPKMGCEGCIYEKTGTNSTYPCSHCRRCFVDKYKAEGSDKE